MITCRHAVGQFGDLVGGSLPSELRELLQRHLEDCPDCRAHLEGYRLTVHLAGRLPCPPLPERLAHRLRALLDEEMTNPFGPGGI